MKLIAVTSAGALLCGMLVLGCAPEQRAPAAAPAPPPPPPTQVEVAATTERQAAPPAYVPLPPEEVPPPPPIAPPPPQPGVNVAPPAYGAPEVQAPEPSAPDVRARTSQTVTLATQQIDRLQRIQATSSGARRDDIEAALSDLQSKRQKVLADLREVELRPPTPMSTMSQQLDRDLADLQGSVKSSYAIAPPPDQGRLPELPEPAPLAPSQLP